MHSSIYIITLDKKGQNPSTLADALTSQGLEPIFFDAIDGRNNIPSLLADESVDQIKAERYRLSELGSAEIGAYLSHYRCIKSAYDNNIDKICILEDDVIIEKNFSTVLNKLLLLDDSYELIRLMDLKRCKRKILNKIYNNYRLCRPEKGTLGAQGYVINRKGMKKIIEGAMPIYKPIDKLIDHFWEIDLHLFSIEPHLIWEKPSNTSIKKPNFKPQVDIFKSARWHCSKLIRSIHRKFYIYSNKKSFFPKSKSTVKMGKTQRKS